MTQFWISSPQSNGLTDTINQNAEENTSRQEGIARNSASTSLDGRQDDQAFKFNVGVPNNTVKNAEENTSRQEGIARNSASTSLDGRQDDQAFKLNVGVPKNTVFLYFGGIRPLWWIIFVD